MEKPGNERLSVLKKLRWAALAEGTSLLLLVFIAMPIKYGLDNPMWVKVLGPIHGFLFIIFLIVVIYSSQIVRFKNLTLLLIILSAFVPFGNFIVDYKYLKPMLDK